MGNNEELFGYSPAEDAFPRQREDMMMIAQAHWRSRGADLGDLSLGAGYDGDDESGAAQNITPVSCRLGGAIDGSSRKYDLISLTVWLLP